MMKKLCMVLCVMIMFFGIVGCPSSDDVAPSSTETAFVSKPATDGTSTSNNLNVSEPATLILLGSGLVVLAGIGRKKFFKKD